MVEVGTSTKTISVTLRGHFVFAGTLPVNGLGSMFMTGTLVYSPLSALAKIAEVSSPEERNFLRIRLSLQMELCSSSFQQFVIQQLVCMRRILKSTSRVGRMK
uniref:Uncharacterized protein n=1 Tax=Anguilla anguilla TaxID=7936 RepID=A0A0E9QQI6_ANGAN